MVKRGVEGGITDSGIAIYRVKRGLSLRSKHIFYPYGNATIIALSGHTNRRDSNILDRKQ